MYVYFPKYGNFKVFDSSPFKSVYPLLKLLSSLAPPETRPTQGVSPAFRAVVASVFRVNLMMWNLPSSKLLVGGLNPSENISQLGWLFPIYGKIKNVPNHQPD